MQISCSTNTSSSSNSTKKKPYKSALREEMAKTFSKFIVQEREQKVNGESKAKPLFVTTPLTAVCPSTNIFQQGISQDCTPHSAKAIGSFNQNVFDSLSSPTPKQQTEINSFQYITFSEDDDEYAKPIDDLNSFIQTYLSAIIDDEEEYDDGDGFSLITSKPKPLKTNFDLDSTTTTTSITTDCSFDDEPPTPKTKPTIATFGGGFGFDFTSLPPKNSFSFSDEDVELKKPHSFTTTSKPFPKKASVDLFAKPIQYDRLDDEFQSLKKFETRLQRKSGMHTSAYRQHNLTKNRYKNILPNENTRVLLQAKERCEPGSDYINANHIITQTTQNFKNIKLSPPPTYIATQAPLPCTFADFWRMIVEHNSTIIVMLSSEVLSSDSESDESNNADQFDQCFNKNKVNKYWPSLYEKKIYGDIEVETILEEHTTFDFIYRQFLVFGDDLPDSGKKIHFYQYTGWPDMGVPDSTVSFFKLIECIDNLMTQPEYPNGPITIHCSAGVGRTGTFCTIHILLSQYKEYLGLPKEERDNDNPFDFNIYKIVKQLKNLRVGMVQRKEQYRYCYYAARDGIKEIHTQFF